MKKSSIVLATATAFCAFAFTACSPAPSAENPPTPPSNTMVAVDFTATVAPAIKKNCMGCHSGATPADNKAFPEELTEAWAKENGKFMKQSAHELEEGKMPPKDAAVKPTAEESKAIIDWVKANIS